MVVEQLLPLKAKRCLPPIVGLATAIPKVGSNTKMFTTNAWICVEGKKVPSLDRKP